MKPAGRFGLVTGGARSGKSRFAEKLMRQWMEERKNAGFTGDRIVYVATAQALDEEMAERIRRHREQRPPDWETVEAPMSLFDVLETLAHRTPPPDGVLVDCATLYWSNRLLAHCGEADAADGAGSKTLDWTAFAQLERQLEEEVDAFGRWLPGMPYALIIVTNEVGWGLVPANALGRAYRDLAGRCNQRLAALAQYVYLVVAGIPVSIKAPGTDG
ncbi:MAG: bifunctional adenosylcobinamide kinase/adenosylcobinamide-phosphate guanylyltransferase [Bacillaceae bacterium G1]|nr:MAG: bifunctional adenosylcobinamide kinase/adenosylcobinamide-phosphate guanylyltransferase [Bacillaceae bacterium G1]